MSLVFYDRLLNLDAEGKPASAAAERGLALSIPAKHSQSGATGPFLIRTYLSNPQSLPGPYKAYLHAAIQREQTFKGTDVSSGGVQLRVTVSDLQKVFDGSEQIVSISAVPWYIRQAFLP